LGGDPLGRSFLREEISLLERDSSGKLYPLRGINRNSNLCCLCSMSLSRSADLNILQEKWYFPKCKFRIFQGLTLRNKCTFLGGGIVQKTLSEKILLKFYNYVQSEIKKLPPKSQSKNIFSRQPSVNNLFLGQQPPQV